MGVKRLIERLLPRSAYRALTAPYHLARAFLAALIHGFPARNLTVIAVTGTKGKSSVTEMIAAILEEAGYSVAVSSTIRFKVGSRSKANLWKMTLPGRGFIQQFLAEARHEGCTHAVIEVTSEAALQYRHLFLDLDALVFTNLQREHLESHGGIERYFAAKMRIGEALVRSKKRPRTLVANADDTYGERFLALPVEQSVPFSLKDAKNLSLSEEGAAFTFDGVHVALPHPGAFSVMNALAALRLAQTLTIPSDVGARALKKLSRIPGRAERIAMGQPFLAVVDYAHTPDSLAALYAAYPQRKICVLGNTGGGRDAWKRPEMGRIAENACAEVILTNEDPYDEDPRAILDAMATGMTKAPIIITDRRDAIREALSRAQPGDAVLITGKGTDPFIMGANGTKTPWSDAQVVREELSHLGYH